MDKPTSMSYEDYCTDAVNRLNDTPLEIVCRALSEMLKAPGGHKIEGELKDLGEPKEQFENDFMPVTLVAQNVVSRLQALIDVSTPAIPSKLTDEIILEKVKRLASNYSCTQSDMDYVESQWADGVPFEGGMSISEALIHIKSVVLREKTDIKKEV